MSRIGRLPIAIPAGVTVEIAENNKVTVTGPKGTLSRELPTEMKIEKLQHNMIYLFIRQCFEYIKANIEQLKSEC